MSENDPDISFTCCWIAFNAACAEDTETDVELPARDLFRAYFEKLLRLDQEGVIYNAVWEKFSGPVRILLGNKYVYQPFWKRVNGVEGLETGRNGSKARRRWPTARSPSSVLRSSWNCF